MPISIDPTRYQKLISSINTKLTDSNENQRIHQLLTLFGICATSESQPSPSLNNRQVNLLESILLTSYHPTQKMDLYLNFYFTYHTDIKLITPSPLYDEDLAKLQSLNIIQMQGNQITLNTNPHQNTNTQPVSSNSLGNKHSQSAPHIYQLLSTTSEASTSTTLHHSNSDAPLNKKRKNTLSSTQLVAQPSQPSTAEHNDTRTTDHEARIAKLEQNYSTLQENYQALQNKYDALEAKFNKPSSPSSSTSSDNFHRGSSSPFLFTAAATSTPLSPIGHLPADANLCLTEEDRTQGQAVTHRF